MKRVATTTKQPQSPPTNITDNNQTDCYQTVERSSNFMGRVVITVKRGNQIRVLVHEAVNCLLVLGVLDVYEALNKWSYFQAIHDVEYIK